MTFDPDAIPTHVTQVRRSVPVTPRVRRVTVGGGLERYRSAGPDSFVYLLLPPPGSNELTVDESFTWAACLAIGDDTRPVGAYYTVREHRPDSGELALEMVLHNSESDGGGHAAAWGAAAQPGDPVALWGPRTAYHPPGDTAELLLVADDTGVPAALSILEQLRPDQRVTALLEVADDDERREIRCAARLDLRWLPRDGVPAGCSTALADEVDAMAPLGPDRSYVWGGGESRSMTAVRRTVRQAWGLDRSRVDLTPYWRHADAPEPELDD